MFTVGFLTGERLEELIVLKWKDINFDEGTFHVQRACCCGQNKETKTEVNDRFNQTSHCRIKKPIKVQRATKPFYLS
jgi:hypothetical protein